MKNFILFLITLLLISTAVAIEYEPGETLYLSVYESANTTYCNLHVWYPNQTKWLDNITTSFLDNNIFYNNSFEIQETYGIYQTVSICNNTIIQANTFDVYENISYQFLIPITLAIFCFIFAIFSISTTTQNMFVQAFFWVLSESLAVASLGMVLVFWTNPIIVATFIVLLGTTAITILFIGLLFFVHIIKKIWLKKHTYSEQYKG